MRHPLLTLVLFSTALTTAGCADDGSSLFITGVGGLTDDTCVIDTSVSITDAVVDISSSSALVIYPVFASQVVDRVSANAANPSDIHVQRVEVRLEDLGGATLDVGLENPFSVPTSAFVEGFMGGGDIPTAAGAVLVLPPGYPEAVLARGGVVLAALRPIGRTNGNIRVEGNFDFRYQIGVCDGCLTRCAVGDEEPVIPCAPGQNALTLLDPADPANDAICNPAP